MTDNNLDAELSKLRIDRSRKKKRRTGKWKTIAVLVILVLSVFSYSFVKSRLPIEVEVVTPVVEKVGNPGEYPVLTAGGYVIPRDSIDVSSKIIGRVEEIFIDRGDKVKAGDVLMKLEDKEQRAQLALAEAQLASARARLEELEAGSRPEEIEAARAAVDSAEATRINAQQELTRLKQLSTNRAISQQELDRALSEYNVAAALLNAAQKRLELAEKGPRKEQIDAARAEVQQAQANVELAKTQLEYTIIRAPISGTILEKVAEQGELLTNINVGGSRGVKSSAVSMADLSDLQVEIDLNENELAKVRKDQKTEIRLDSAPERVYEGRVDEIAPQADRQKATVQVKIDFLNPDGLVRPEVNARVTFLEQRQAATQPTDEVHVWIPDTVIRTSDQGQSVFVVKDNKAELRKIETGVEGELGLLVRKGLSGSEQIIAAPLEGIEDGRAVKVMLP